jgi:hypothetical protein
MEELTGRGRHHFARPVTAVRAGQHRFENYLCHAPTISRSENYVFLVTEAQATLRLFFTGVTIFISCQS